MATKLNLLPAVPGLKKATILDKKATGTNGGTFTSGSFITRSLNYIEGGTDIVSLSSNQVTLQPGSYLIFGQAPAFKVGTHQCVIYNITTSTNSTIGTSSLSSSSANTASYSYFSVKIVITVPTTYEIRHRCGTTRAVDGLGITSGFSEEEVYTTVNIIQLAE